MFSACGVHLIVSSCFTVLTFGVVELKYMIKYGPSHLLTIHVLFVFKFSFEEIYEVVCLEKHRDTDLLYKDELELISVIFFNNIWSVSTLLLKITQLFT